MKKNLSSQFIILSLIATLTLSSTLQSLAGPHHVPGHILERAERLYDTDGMPKKRKKLLDDLIKKGERGDLSQDDFLKSLGAIEEGYKTFLANSGGKPPKQTTAPKEREANPRIERSASELERLRTERPERIREARLFREKHLDMKDVWEKLRILTGEDPMPGVGMLEDRTSIENRIHVRRFLIQTLESYGYKVSFEAKNLADARVVKRTWVPDPVVKKEEPPKEAHKKTSEATTPNQGTSAEKKKPWYEAILPSRFQKPEPTHPVLSYDYDDYGHDDYDWRRNEKTSWSKPTGHFEETLLETLDDYERHIRAELLNLVVEIPGSNANAPFIEVNAHYDTAGPRVKGADDNGSGLTTVLALAKALRTAKPEKPIRLLITDLEERGNKGTELHVEKLRERNESIHAAFVLDMFGYFPKGVKEKPHFVIETGEPRDFDKKSGAYTASVEMANILKAQAEAFSDRHTIGHVLTHESAPGTADHGPYWRKGFPALLIAAEYESPFINPGYHKESDKIDLMDPAYFEDIMKQVAETVFHMAGVKNEVNSPAALAQLKALETNADPLLDHVKVVDDTPKKEKSYGFGGGSSFGSSSFSPSGFGVRHSPSSGGSGLGSPGFGSSGYGSPSAINYSLIPGTNLHRPGGIPSERMKFRGKLGDEGKSFPVYLCEGNRFAAVSSDFEKFIKDSVEVIFMGAVDKTMLLRVGPSIFKLKDGTFVKQKYEFNPALQPHTRGMVFEISNAGADLEKVEHYLQAAARTQKPENDVFSILLSLEELGVKFKDTPGSAAQLWTLLTEGNPGGTAPVAVMDYTK